jgi:hypothetical protein
MEVVSVSQLWIPVNQVFTILHYPGCHTRTLHDHHYFFGCRVNRPLFQQPI